MTYEFAKYPDGTLVVFSNICKKESGEEYINITFERKAEKGFDTFVIEIPSYNVVLEEGSYSKEEIQEFKETVKRETHLFFKCAKEAELKNNAIIHKDNSLHRLDLSFLKHIELSEYKKCSLLAYWINDFAEYHDQESAFDISRSGVYSRGDIIKVNLGFNIGNELGGLHYCIVLNKYDNTRNGALNVIPLTSRKDNKKYDLSSVNLGQEIYNLLQEKIEKEKQKLHQILNELEKIEDIPINIKNIIEREQNYIEKMEQEISKMKKDSIALINQITTISKQRIYKDIVRRNVKISSKSLDLIDKNIIKFFTK